MRQGVLSFSLVGWVEARKKAVAVARVSGQRARGCRPGLLARPSASWGPGAVFSPLERGSQRTTCLSTFQSEPGEVQPFPTHLRKGGTIPCGPADIQTATPCCNSAEEHRPSCIHVLCLTLTGATENIKDPGGPVAVKCVICKSKQTNKKLRNNFFFFFTSEIILRPGSDFSI